MIRPTQLQRRALEAIAEPITPTELGESIGTRPKAAWMLLQAMVRRGLVKRVSYGRYWFAHPERHGAEA